MNESKGNPLDWSGGFQWINDYVDNIMKDALSAHTHARNGGANSKLLPVELFQTHYNVVARFRVPPGINEQRLKLYVSRQRIKLSGLPGGEEQQVALPVPVYPHSSKALFKDGILQVKLMKRNNEEHFEEVYIRYR